MAERFNTVSAKATISEVPGVDFGTGGAKALDAVSKLLYGVAVEIDDDLDNRAKIDAARKGAQDGLAAGTFVDKDGRLVATGSLNQRLLYAPTISGEAYRESALSHYRNKIELDARVKMNDLFANNPTDPLAIEKKAKAYLTGVTEAMPDEIKPLFEQQFEIMAAPFIAKADEARTGIAKAAQEGQAEALDNVIAQNASGVATAYFSDNETVAALSRRSLFAMRSAIETRYSATITDSNGNSIPAFSPKKVVEALAAFDQMVARAAYQGWFTEHLKEDRAVEALEAFRDGTHPRFTVMTGDVDAKGNFVRVPIQLKTKARAALIKEFIAGIKFQNGQEERGHKLSERKITKNTRTKLLAYAQAGPDGKKAALDAMMGDPNILPSALLTAQKSFAAHQKDGDRDEEVIRDTRLKILTGEITDLSQIPTVGLGDERSTLETLTANRQDSAHWLSSQAWTLGDKFIHNAAGVVKGDIFFGGAGDDRREKVGAALNVLLIATREAEKAGILPANINNPQAGEFDIFKKAQEIAANTFGTGNGTVDPTEAKIALLREQKNALIANPNKTDDIINRMREIDGEIGELLRLRSEARKR